MSEIQDTLDGVAQAAQVLGGTLPGAAGVVARIIGMAASVGAAFAKDGKDPELEIKRILSADPMVKQVHDDWKSAIDAKFGVAPASQARAKEPAGADKVPDTQPDLGDPYEDE